MSLVAHLCSSLTLLSVFRTLQVTLAPASGSGAAIKVNEGPMATLAPNVVLQIFNNLAITDIWNMGSLNSHLRNLAQSEVWHRFHQHFEAMFQTQTDAFFEVLWITGGAVFGSSLLDTFYLASIDYGLPPTIVCYDFKALAPKQVLTFPISPYPFQPLPITHPIFSSYSCITLSFRLFPISPYRSTSFWTLILLIAYP